jgi:hypothetical protein
MNYTKLDASLSSALAQPPVATQRRGAAVPQYRVFIELNSRDADMAQLAKDLSISLPQAGNSIITTDLSADQLEAASEHPVVKRLSLSRMLRRAK